jgi:hypothetical protein
MKKLTIEEYFEQQYEANKTDAQKIPKDILPNWQSGNAQDFASGGGYQYMRPWAVFYYTGDWWRYVEISRAKSSIVAMKGGGLGRRRTNLETKRFVALDITTDPDCEFIA